MTNKSWLIVLGMVVFAGIILYLFRPADGIVNYPPTSDVVVAFGDSLVQGVGSTKGNDFVSKLSAMTGRTIMNLGVSGNTTVDGSARLKEVTELKPGVVVLLLGGNDYLKRIPVAETFSNLSKIIDALHESGAVVVLLGVRGGLLNDHFDDDFKNLAKQKRVLFVPNILEGLLGEQSLMSDQVHPNDAGYEKIAQKVYPVLIKALPR